MARLARNVFVGHLNEDFFITVRMMRMLPDTPRQNVKLQNIDILWWDSTEGLGLTCRPVVKGAVRPEWYPGATLAQSRNRTNSQNLQTHFGYKNSEDWFWLPSILWMILTKVTLELVTTLYSFWLNEYIYYCSINNKNIMFFRQIKLRKYQT